MPIASQPYSPVPPEPLTTQPIHVSQQQLVVSQPPRLIDAMNDASVARNGRDGTRDDARLVQLEAELRARCEQLAHDLRSSLTAASFAAELLEGARNDPEHVDALAEAIKEALDRTQKLIVAALAQR